MKSPAQTRDPLLAAAALKASGTPFVLATVVRAQAPTSARLGDKAIFTKDGLALGWVGGSCAEPIVKEEAEAALADGEPRLVCITPDADALLHRVGLVVHTMTCFSGGSVEIYLEPHVPAPRLVVFGNSPVAQALVELGRVMKYEITVVDLGDRPEMADATTVHSLDELTVSPLAEAYAVVSSHGVFDEQALEKALSLDAKYTGFVTSRRRRDQVLAGLAAKGVAADALARIQAPAGLDLGAKTPEEIALSVMASIVAVRRGHTAKVEVPAPVVVAAEIAAPAPAPALELAGAAPKAGGCCHGKSKATPPTE